MIVVLCLMNVKLVHLPGMGPGISAEIIAYKYLMCLINLG